jgi:hypothetical protein
MVSNRFQQQQGANVPAREPFVPRFKPLLLLLLPLVWENLLNQLDNQPPLPATETPSTEVPSRVPANTFTKVDNNLTGIGFFTASSKRSRKAIEKTTIMVDQGVKYRISILPSAKYGLPITQDQDYWLALMHLVEKRRRQEGKFTNPFVFATAEIIQILGQVDSGQNYKAVQEWLSVMAFTGIEGGAYNVAQKRWSIDRTHAVERIVSAGKKLPDETIADKNYVWFSQWQLDNINAGNLIAIEMSTYTQLENNISRTLVPHLQEWLFASQRDGRFEKKYEDVCQLLGVRIYQYHSDIERQFKPSLDELTTFGYLAKWAIDPMADREHYKLVLWHGPKYHRDRKARQESQGRIEPPGGDEAQAARQPRQRRLNLASPAEPERQTTAAAVIDPQIIAELAQRGIGETDARQILGSLPPDHPVLDVLEYGDSLVSRKRSKIENPPGFYISLLLRKVPVPASFLSSRKAREIEAANQAKYQARMERQAAELAAEEEERRSLNARIAAMTPEVRQELFGQATKKLLQSHPKWGFEHYLKTNPEALGEEGPVYGQMRQMLKEGWNPSLIN